MKKRNVLAVIFYSIITLGIYDLFWLAKTKKVLNRDTKVHTPSLWLLFGPPLALMAIIIILGLTIGFTHSTGTTDFTANNSLNSTSQAGTTSLNVAFILVYVLGILAMIPITFYWFIKFSKAVNEYTNGELSTAVTFLLLYVLRFIGIAVVQDKFNDMVDAGQSGHGASNDSSNQGLPPTAPEAAPTPTPLAPEPPVATPTPVAPPADTPVVQG